MVTENVDSLSRYAVKEIAKAFEHEVIILLPDENGKLQVTAQLGKHTVFDERVLGVAIWVFQRELPVERETETLFSATLIYLPM